MLSIIAFKLFIKYKQTKNYRVGTDHIIISLKSAFTESEKYIIQRDVFSKQRNTVYLLLKEEKDRKNILNCDL